MIFLDAFGQTFFGLSDFITVLSLREVFFDRRGLDLDLKWLLESDWFDIEELNFFGQILFVVDFQFVGFLFDKVGGFGVLVDNDFGTNRLLFY